MEIKIIENGTTFARIQSQDGKRSVQFFCVRLIWQKAYNNERSRIVLFKMKTYFRGKMFSFHVKWHYFLMDENSGGIRKSEHYNGIRSDLKDTRYFGSKKPPTRPLAKPLSPLPNSQNFWPSCLTQHTLGFSKYV